MKQRLKYLIVLNGLLLAACGNSYSSSYYRYLPLIPVNSNQCSCAAKGSPPPRQAATPRPSATVTQKPAAPVISRDEQAKTIYTRMVKKLKGIDTFKMSVQHYVKGNLYRKKPVAEPMYGIATNYIVFQRPRKTFIKIIESKDDPDLKDTRLLYDGGKDIKIKVPGILGLFTFTFSLDKPELSNYRGYTVADIDLISLEQQLDNPNARVKLTGVSEVFDVPVYILEVTNIKTIDDQVTKVVLGVSKKDFIPVLHEMYAGEELVYQEKFQNFSYNIPVTEADFKL